MTAVQQKTGPVLEIDRLSISYGGRPAVSNVSLAIQPGEVVGIIGESGSGKSTLAHSILGLLPTSATVSGGALSLCGRNLLGAGSNAFRAMRGPGAAMVFQNPMTTFSPLHRLGDQLTDLLWREKALSKEEKRARIVTVFKEVGLSNAAGRLANYPFELSGGMLQRVAIAAALMLRPSLLIADEPTTALDVTMEAQILHLMRELRAEAGVAVLMISHHLGVIAEICDRVVVMYGGRVVEEGPVQAIFANPTHPYTKALFACEPALIAPGVHRMPVIDHEALRRAQPARETA